GNEGLEVERATWSRGKVSPPAQLHSLIHGCSRASDIEPWRPSFRAELNQSFSSSFAPLRARSSVRAPGHRPGDRATAEWKSGKHSGGNRGRCETLSSKSSLPGRDVSRPQSERQLSLSGCCPGARIRAPAKREG